MDKYRQSFRDMSVRLLAVLVLCLGIPVPAAMSDGDARIDPPVPVYPRWSNDHQRQGIWATPDCQIMPPGMAADYVRNTDAWGRQVIPADQPPVGQGGIAVGVVGEVDLGQRRIGGKRHDLTGVYLLDPQYGNNGIPPARDCAPPAK